MPLSHPVIVLMATALLASCRDGSVSLTDLAERHEALEAEAAASRRQLTELRASIQGALDSKEAAFDQFAQAIRSLNDTSEGIRTTLEAFAAYKREYRKKAREKAPGTVLGDIALGTQTLRAAVIREVTDTHISLRHANGTARITLLEAPIDLQARYGFDPAMDLVIAKAEGTGTDWLLSAMDAVDQLTSPPAATPSAATSGSIGGTNARIAASGTAYSSSASAPVYGSRPTWTRFSSFTGSFWAPLQQRKQRVGSVNSWSPSSSSASLIDY
jgi:hypothetical protein